MQEDSTAKVLFRIQEEDGTSTVETLWAFDLGHDRYRLDNSPFYAYSVSWQDIVYAPVKIEEGLPTFDHVLEKSGNCTVRIILDPPAGSGGASDDLLETLVALGCSYEGSNRKLMSVNIPPSTGLDQVRKLLIERNATWEHADPTYEVLFPNAA